ncbi:MAG: DUF4364 family protein [Clostridiaceae bacterium]|nr:DUF4364 family protein [Clostridiaceae bacterium]
MSNSQLPNAKLIILYILQKIPGISATDLMKQSIDSLYMDYFMFSQAKDELLRDHLMIESVRKGETRKTASGHPLALCDITPEGQSVLTRLLPTLPTAALSYLTAEASKSIVQIKKSTEVRAYYEPDADGHYNVHLILKEGERYIINITLNAPNEKVAEHMIRRWKENTSTIYATLINQLSDPK